jgi:hypothetical protein
MTRKFVKNEEGVSNIVTSIMMLGVLMSIFGMIMSVYMPVLAKGTEINHMDEVGNVFIDLKGTIDRQIISNQVGTTLSNRIKLGNEGGQFLGVGRTTGTIRFEPHHSPGIIYNTESDLDPEGRPLDIYGTNRGMITYEANNVYYIDQEYIYENGAVIIDQGERYKVGPAVMRVKPTFDAYQNNITGKTTVIMTMISLDGTTTQRGGQESHTIETTLQIGTESRLPFQWGNGTYKWSGENITYEFTTAYPDLWEEFYMSVLNETGSNLVLDPDGAGPQSGDYYIEQNTPIDPMFINKDKEYTVISLTIKDVNELDIVQAVIETTIN